MVSWESIGFRSFRKGGTEKVKAFTKAVNFVITALLVLVIAGSIGLSVAGRRSPDGIPTVAGHKVLNVLSGSMAPAINVGDVIIVEPLAPDRELKEGDVVTFRAGGAKDMLITHRIVGTVMANDEPAAYVTKGDANDAQDLAPITRDQVVGVYVGRIPYFGYVANFVRTPIGVVLLLVIPGLLIIIGEVRNIYQILLEEEQKKAQARAEAQQEGR